VARTATKCPVQHSGGGGPADTTRSFRGAHDGCVMRQRGCAVAPAVARNVGELTDFGRGCLHDVSFLSGAQRASNERLARSQILRAHSRTFSPSSKVRTCQKRVSRMLDVAQFRLWGLETDPQQRRAPQTEERKPESIANLQTLAVAERREAEPTTGQRNELGLAVRQATIELLAESCRQ